MYNIVFSTLWICITEQGFEQHQKYGINLLNLKKPLIWFLLGFSHDDEIKWKNSPRYWPIVRRFHRWPVNSPRKGQWRGALIFTLICAWINGRVNNREAGDLRHHRAHYDVILMWLFTVLGSNGEVTKFSNAKAGRLFGKHTRAWLWHGIEYVGHTKGFRPIWWILWPFMIHLRRLKKVTNDNKLHFKALQKPLPGVYNPHAMILPFNSDGRPIDGQKDNWPYHVDINCSLWFPRHGTPGIDVKKDVIFGRAKGTSHSVDCNVE